MGGASEKEVGKEQRSIPMRCKAGLCIYIYTHIHMCVYVYVYIYRERGREKLGFPNCIPNYTKGFPYGNSTDLLGRPEQWWRLSDLRGPKVLKIMQRAGNSLDRASETTEKIKGNIGGKNMELRGGGGRVLEVGGLWRWEDLGGGRAWEAGG